MNYNWNWGIFWQDSPEGNGTYLDMLLSGLKWTIVTALCAWVLALILGTIIGVMRTLPSKGANRFASGYVEFFRNIPILVQLFLWYFVLPELLPRAAGMWLKQLPNASFWTAFIGLGFYMSARVAVQLQSGIGALPRGQAMAGKALGLTTTQTYRYVLLPMALRIVIPPLTSESMNIVKNSSVAFAVSVAELTFFARQSGEETSQPVQMYLAVTLLYAVSAFTINRVMAWVEKRSRVPGFVAAGGMGGGH